MKQAAILYALSNIGPRLARVRTRTWVFIGLGVAAVLALMAWAAIAVLSWAWGQLPGLADSGRQAAGAAMEKVEQVAPGLKGQIDPLLGQVGLGAGEKAAETPATDVSGTDLPGVARYPGSVRSYFAREAGRTELRYTGQGEVRAVLDHYLAQFTAAGYGHEVLSATPEAERHRFAKAGDTLDFEIRKAGADGGVEVVLVHNLI
jgi:hypothetical protein